MKKLLMTLSIATLTACTVSVVPGSDGPEIIKPDDVNSQGQATTSLSDAEIGTNTILAMYFELPFDDCKIYFDNTVFRTYSSSSSNPGEVSQDRLTLRAYCEMQNSYVWELENWDDQNIVTTVNETFVNDINSYYKNVTVRYKITQTRYVSTAESKTVSGCFDDVLLLNKRTYGWMVAEHTPGSEYICTW